MEGYKSNRKKGKAKVVLKGTGAYAGIKSLPFKIIEKNVDFKGTLRSDGWD